MGIMAALFGFVGPFMAAGARDAGIIRPGNVSVRRSVLLVDDQDRLRRGGAERAEN
jgi:hypothetical protein